MPLIDSLRAASQSLAELTERVKAFGSAARQSRAVAGASDATLADAIKRGQTPELIAALKKALGT